MRAWVLAIAASFLAGIGLGMYVSHDVQPQPSRNLPAVHLEGGGLVLRQNPAEPAPVIHHLPRGYKVQSIARIRIEPGLNQIEPRLNQKSGSIGSIQSLTVAQVATKDGPRVVVESDTGQVIGGASWAPAGPPAPHVFHWQALAVRAWTPQGAAWGASVGYTRGPLIATVTVIPPAGIPGSIQAGIGVRW